MGTDLLQIDTQARPANSNSAWILQGKKGRADAASKRCSTIKSQTVANKCERVKAKSCNLSAEAHSSGVLQFDIGPRLQDWKRCTSKYFKFQIALSRPVRYFLRAGVTRFSRLARGRIEASKRCRAGSIDTARTTAVGRAPRELCIWQRVGCVPNPA